MIKKWMMALCILVVALLPAGCALEAVEDDAVRPAEETSQEEVPADPVLPEDEAEEPDTESTEIIGISDLLEEEVVEYTEYESGHFQPVISAINHYVIDPATGSNMTEQDYEYYKMMIDAILCRQESMYLVRDYDKLLYIWYLLEGSPYEFLVKKVHINNAHDTMSFEYAFDAEEHASIIEYVDREYMDIFSKCVSPEMSDLEKVLAIYRYFDYRIQYDYEWADALAASDEPYLFPDITIYEALTTSYGVCHTYSYLCEFAFLQLGIDSVELYGTATDDSFAHMWLLVKIGDEYYHLDPTWDDQGKTASLQYFGMTDDESYARGVYCSDMDIREDLSEIDCTDSRFCEFRNITSYTIPGDGKLYAHIDGEDEITVITLSDYEYQSGGL